MYARLVDLVVCPACQGTLSLSVERSQGVEILEGALACTLCPRTYPVVGGVPRLVPDAAKVPKEAQRTVDRFGQEWNQFDSISPRYEAQFLDWIAPNPKEVFRDRVVLEGGCGKGRHSRLAARWGAKEVIAIDLGSAVDTAHKNAGDEPNVHIVQGDLFNLPVKAESVDIAFSVGVLHHTHSPRQAFLELCERVRPGGRVFVWVYGAENNEWITRFVDPWRKAVTSRLPHDVVYQLSKLPAFALFGATQLLYGSPSAPLRALGDRFFYRAYLEYIAEFPFSELHSIVHDHLIPPIAHYIRREELESWLRAARLDQVEIGWHNQNSWRATGIRTK